MRDVPTFTDWSYRTLTETLHSQARGLIRPNSAVREAPFKPQLESSDALLTCLDGNLDKNPA